MGDRGNKSLDSVSREQFSLAPTTLSLASLLQNLAPLLRVPFLRHCLCCQTHKQDRDGCQHSHRKRNTHQIRRKKTDCGENKERGEEGGMEKSLSLSTPRLAEKDSRPEEDTSEEARKRRVQGLSTPTPSIIGP